MDPEQVRELLFVANEEIRAGNLTRAQADAWFQSNANMSFSDAANVVRKLGLQEQEASQAENAQRVADATGQAKVQETAQQLGDVGVTAGNAALFNLVDDLLTGAGATGFDERDRMNLADVQERSQATRGLIRGSQERLATNDPGISIGAQILGGLAGPAQLARRAIGGVTSRLPQAPTSQLFPRFAALNRPPRQPARTALQAVLGGAGAGAATAGASTLGAGGSGEDALQAALVGGLLGGGLPATGAVADRTAIPFARLMLRGAPRGARDIVSLLRPSRLQPAVNQATAAGVGLIPFAADEVTRFRDERSR